jgi:hypothetical protein
MSSQLQKKSGSWTDLYRRHASDTQILKSVTLMSGSDDFFVQDIFPGRVSPSPDTFRDLMLSQHRSSAVSVVRGRLPTPLRSDLAVSTYSPFLLSPGYCCIMP